MQDKDWLVVGGIALIVWMLCKRSAHGGGAGASGGTGGAGCGCAGSPSARLDPWTGGVRAGCPSPSPGNGAYTQGAGPYPPEAFTGYTPPSSDAWDAPGFHIGFDLSLGF
jgi:hypothetical protein